MRRDQVGLVITAAVAVFAITAAMVGAPTPIMAILGLGLFAAPGYVWGSLFVDSDLVGLERAAVAGGIVLAIPVVGGVVLYMSGARLDRISWVWLLASVTLVGDAVHMRRRQVGPKRAVRIPQGGRTIRPSRLLAFGVATVMVLSAFTLARAGVAMQRYPGFTELWLNKTRGNSSIASLGVSNHQGGNTRYRLVLLRRHRVSASWEFSLVDGQTWRRSIPFTNEYSIVANLYRLPERTSPYRQVTNGIAGARVR
jgi:hypothetical protein